MCANWGDIKGKIVAVKLLSQRAPAHLIDQLKNEIKVLEKCNHPNVIRIYDWFEDGEFVGYAMEYAPYGTLEDFIERNGIVSIHESLIVLKQLALGIHEIHSQGYIHRDLKPQNVFLTKEGTIKVGDLGIALHQSHAAKISIDEITGTVDFLSPEYVSKGICDVRADIYAWGSIAYLFLTGMLPFKEESIIETLLKKASTDPIYISSFREDIPHDVSRLIMRAIARDPETRFQSTFEVIRDIDEAISQTEIGSKPQKLVA